MDFVRWMPGLALLRDYKVSYFPRDLAAGVTLGAVMVPVGLAYGEMAGLPLAGLYGSMLPLLAYALFGSSRQIVVGPDSAMAAIVAVVVLPMAAGDAGRLAVLAASLGIMVGIVCLLAGGLKLGFVANFLSKPVIVGFMHGLALVIIGAQLPKLLGLKSEGETTIEQFINVGERIGGTHATSLAIGAACIAIILLCRRFAPKFPGAILALVASGLAVVLWELDKKGVAIVGAIPTGLPGFSLPVIGFADFEALLPVALVAALLSFSDTMIVARAFAVRSGQKIDADQELVALGVANLVSGVSKGLPISASDSRTAVAEAAGARTQATSVIAAIVIAGTMLWLTGLLRYLPTAALAGVMIAAAINVCDFREFARLWRFRGVDLAGALLTLVGVAVLGLMEGILLGVVFALIQLLRAFAFPPDAVLGRLPDGTWHDPAYRREAEKVPGLLVYRFSGPLFFANVGLFRERIDTQLAEHPGLKAIVLDCGAIHHVDLMACEMLAELDRDLQEHGVRLAFADLRDRVKRDIIRGLELGPHMPDPTFPSVEEAAQAMSNTFK